MSLSWDEKVYVVQRETTYGESPGAFAATHAILTRGLEITPLAGDRIERDVDRPYLGARPSALVNQRVETNFRLDAVTAGTTKLDAGEAPAHSALTRGCGLAETIVAPGATIEASPGTPAQGNSGSMTYTAGDPYQGLLDRTVTLTCTTAGGSGIAEFTVAAPATRHLAAYNETGVVMTDGSPFPLPGNATIVPTVGTDFAVDDEIAIDLTAAGTFYTPVSDSFDSAHAFVDIDGNRHPISGQRGSLAVNGEADGWLQFAYTLMGLFGAPTSETPFTVDYSAFLEPEPVTDATTPWFAIDGVEFPMRSVGFDLAQGTTKRSLVGQNAVVIPSRNGSFRCTIEAPDVATKNFFDEISKNNATVKVELIHGTERGNQVHVEAPRVELANPRYSDEQRVAMLQLEGRLLPTDAGNDELTIACK